MGEDEAGYVVYFPAIGVVEMTRQQAWNKYMVSRSGKDWRENVKPSYIRAYRSAFMAAWKARGRWGYDA